MKYVKRFDDYVLESAEVRKGSDIWKYVKDITPEKENIPDGFKDKISKRKFEYVDKFDLKSLLKTDRDFKAYYDGKENRYEYDDLPTRDLLQPIVVVDGELLDGYSRSSQLLRKGNDEAEAFVALPK
jgi:hypothetical protein